MLERKNKSSRFQQFTTGVSNIQPEGQNRPTKSVQSGPADGFRILQRRKTYIFDISLHLSVLLFYYY